MFDDHDMRYPIAVVNALLDGADMPSAPVTFTDACRRVLRTLPAGPVREELRERAALTDVPEATAAVVDAGYLRRRATPAGLPVPHRAVGQLRPGRPGR